MAALSNYAEKLLLDWMMTAGSATRPTSWYVALFTDSPTDAGTGTEVSGSGYTRQSATFDLATSGTGTTANNNNVVFTAAGGNWGTVSHIGIYDASTSGNLLWHGAMTVSKIVNDGDSLEFSAGNIDLTIA